MSGISADRPQDVGRRHKPRRIIAERNRALLGAYQDDMRRELRNLLNALRTDGLSLAEREKRWRFASFLARELGEALEEPTKLHPPTKAVDDGPGAAANF